MFGNYGNPYGQFLQNLQQPTTGVPMQNQQTIPLPQETVVRVNGEAGARTYQMGPNSSKLMLDETAPVVWLAQTDGAGYKTVTPYKITPFEEEKKIDVKSIEERLSKLEARYESDFGKTE